MGGGQSPVNFDIAPEATRQVKVETVCLDHNNPTPRPTMKYEIRPMSAAVNKEGVAEICELMGRHEVGHRVAQLVAWHLNNGLSWETLAGLRHQAGHRHGGLLQQGRDCRGQEGQRKGPGLAQGAERSRRQAGLEESSRFLKFRILATDGHGSNTDGRKGEKREATEGTEDPETIH